MAGAVENLRSTYRCARVEVIADRDHGDRVVVVLHRLLLPPVCPYPLTTSPAVFLPDFASVPLPLGLDARRDLVSVPLFDPHIGGNSVLCAGVPGAGKTTALRVLLAGLASTNTSVAVIDPTGGSESSLWGSRLSEVVASADAEPTTALLRDVLGLIVGRGALRAAGLPVVALPPLLLVCDELAELAAAGNAKQQDEARTLLRRITALGRKANVAVLLATQRTTATSIDVTTRSIVSWRIGLAHPDDPHGSEAVLGPGRHHAARLARDDRGAAYVTDGGPPILTRVFDLPPSSVADLAQRGSSRSLAELCAWDEAALRELRAF